MMKIFLVEWKKAVILSNFLPTVALYMITYKAFSDEGGAMCANYLHCNSPFSLIIYYLKLCLQTHG